MNYAEWSERYVKLFGLVSDVGLSMLREIRDLCEKHGYTVEELNDATDWIAVNNPPRFPSDHMAILSTALRDLRTKKFSRPAPVEPWPEAEDRGTCSLCGGSGMVSVPCPRHLAIGKWGTTAVLCSCPLGRWVGDRQCGKLPSGEPRPPMLSLGQYEMLHPDWKQKLRQHEEEQKRQAEAERGNKPLNPVIDRLMARIAQRRRQG